jgi:hypothetical protein
VQIISANIRDECACVSAEIPSAVFVGAAATLAHLGWTFRTTTDLDVVVEVVSDVDDDRLLQLNYWKDPKSKKWYTPRGTKIDIYKGTLNGFTVSDIATQSTTVYARKGVPIKVAKLEMLILMKHRAGLASDVQALVKTKFSSMNWNYLEGISKDPPEFEEIRNVARAFGLLKP